MKANKRDLTVGAIPAMLARLTWPMIFGMMGMVMFNLVDAYFLGKVGVNELAALSFTFPVVMFITSISMGMGIGTSSLISRTIVSDSKKTVQTRGTSALLLSLILIVIFVIAGQLTIKPLFRAMGAQDHLVPLVFDYMHIWYWGMVFVVIPMVGNNIIRASGDTFTPGMLMLVSAVINIILDPILIFGWGPIPAMSLKGAAIATVIARAAGFAASFYILAYRDKLVTLRLPQKSEILDTWRKVMFIAGPASVALLVTPVSLGVITRIVAQYGEEAVASFGVVSRIEMFGLMVIHALATVMIIFGGQNFAAKKFERLKSGLNAASLFSLMWGTLLFIVVLFFSVEIAGLFSDDARVVAITAKYLRIVTFSYTLQGVMMVVASLFNGLNKPIPSSILIVVRMLVLYVPLAWIGSSIYGLTGVFWAAFVANVAVGITAYFWMGKYLRNKRIE